MNRQRKIEYQTNEAQDERNRSGFKTPEGTRREGPPFPFNLRTKSQESILQILLLGRKNREEERGARERWWRLFWWVPGAGERGER